MPAGHRLRQRGGTHELIDHDRTGLLLYRGGPDALADSMARYVAAPDLARRHGEAGWATARQRHSIEAYAAQIAEVLVRLRQSHTGYTSRGQE